jgi:hypothetical protein
MGLYTKLADGIDEVDVIIAGGMWLSDTLPWSYAPHEAN